MNMFIAVLLVSLCSFFSNAFADSLKFALVGVEENTEGHRITQSLADEIGARSGIDISIRIYPAKRAKQFLEAGEVDGDWARVDGYGRDIPGLVRISEPTASHPYLAYSTRNDIIIDGWKSLKPYKVVHPRGWKVIELNLEAFHDDLFPVNSVDSGLGFIARGRADVFINIPFIVDSYLRKGGVKYKDIKALQPPLAFLHVYTYLLPKHAVLAKRMEAALVSMKADGTYGKIMSGSD